MANRSYITPDEFRAKPLAMPLRQYSDVQIQEYAEIATSNVEDFLERILARQSYTETFRGDGSTTFLLHEYPLISVSSLTEKTVASTPVTTTYTLSHLVRTSDNDAAGRIELDGLGEFTAFDPANLYTITYEAGFDSIPPKVKHATALWICELLSPDYTRSEDGQQASSEQIVELLTPIRRRRI